MAKKDIEGNVSPFDAHLEPNENILWIEHQEWVKNWRVTRGHKISGVIILALLLLLIFMIQMLFGENAWMVYCVVGFQIFVGILYKASYVFSGFSYNPTYFHCWYAVTNRRVLVAFKERVDSMTLLETEHIGKINERRGRGRLDFQRHGKAMPFIDIPDVDRVHQLILEQQRFLLKMEQSQA
jgi:hypothetical protein